ncbi:MAG: formate acetyltransferase, partial [Clostridia bacterium]|nr:formate acetyltransferase [Clostridia bacterium]
MSQIKYVGCYSDTEKFDYDKRIKLLRERKVMQTEEKARNGGANEDDYGLIVQNEFSYKLKPNHENGSIYGYKAWTENYCAILDSHPLYCDSLDAFVGK